MPNFFALDLEMEQPSNEIISIGVAYQNNDGFINRMNFLVTPSQPLSPFIKELTGLSDDMFNWSKSRKQCFMEFLQAHEVIMTMNDIFKEAVTWGCGDVHLLRRQISEEGLEISCLSRRFIDVKTLLMMERVYQGKSISGRMSLNSGLKEYKMDFVGDAHNSSWDALNTLILFFQIITKRKKLNTILNDLKAI